MKACIVCIGDELLIGQTINTNASWLGSQLNASGINVIRVLTISDQETEIIHALDTAKSIADVVLITGGLGPTKDDITKHTLCKYFNTTLELNQEVLAKLKVFFEKRGRPMLEANIKQAEIPVDCKMLPNNNGTAQGMWFESDNRIFVSMPGVPYEMKGIMIDHVLPALQNLNHESISQRTLLTTGLGESFMAELIKDIEINLRNDGLGLAYLPSLGLLKLRITAKGLDKHELDLKVNNYAEKIKSAIGNYFFAEGETTLEQVIAKWMAEEKKTLGAVESCTGGRVGQTIISVPGASDFYNGTIVAYAYSIKEKIVGLNHEKLVHHGAVSEWCAMELASKGRELLNTDYCISTTGIAGPGGGTETKPVGTVWIGYADKNKCFAKKFQFGDHRDRNIQMTVAAALNLLRLELEINS